MAVEINKHIGFFAEALLRPQLGHIGSGALPAQRPIVFDFALRKKLDLETFTRASGAMYWDGPAGKLASVGNNVPVREWSARGIFKGRRIEESRTNLLLWSEALNNAVWVKGGVSVNPADGISVKGITLHKAVGDGTDFRFIRQSLGTVNNGASITLSAFIKAGDSTQTAIRIDDPNDGVNARYTVPIDWINGVPSLAAPIPVGLTETRAPTLVDLGDGLYRVSISATNATGTDRALSAIYYVRWIGGPGVPEFTYVGGLQGEAGAFPTSYIKTEGSQVTRAADFCTISDISGFFNPNEGTLFFEGSRYPGVGASFAAGVSICDGTVNEEIYVTNVNDQGERGRALIVDGGSTVGTLTFSPGGWPLGTVNRIAVAYRTNDCAAACGGELATDSSVTLPTVDRIHIGRRSVESPNSYWNGHICRILYWPKRLPNQQLQLLSKAA